MWSIIDRCFSLLIWKADTELSRFGSHRVLPMCPCSEGSANPRQKRNRFRFEESAVGEWQRWLRHVSRQCAFYDNDRSPWQPMTITARVPYHVTAPNRRYTIGCILRHFAPANSQSTARKGRALTRRRCYCWLFGNKLVRPNYDCSPKFSLFKSSLKFLWLYHIPLHNFNLCIHKTHTSERFDACNCMASKTLTISYT